MASSTLFLSKLIGLYCILCALAMMIHKQATVDTITALLNNSPTLFLTGIICLIAGLAMVLVHNLWSGGPLTVVVTLVGWLTLLKGLLAVFLPMHAEAGLYLRVFHYQQLFYLYASIVLVLGLYVTYAGFWSKVKK